MEIGYVLYTSTTTQRIGFVDVTQNNLQALVEEIEELNLTVRLLPWEKNWRGKTFEMPGDVNGLDTWLTEWLEDVRRF